MALEGVKSEKSEENHGSAPDGKANGIDNKSKQVRIPYIFLVFLLQFSSSTFLDLIVSGSGRLTTTLFS